MALTRKMLKAMGIDDEKIDQIIEAHTETVDALKDERDKFREDAEKLPDVQKKLDAALKANSGDESFESKYNKLNEDFEKYKSEVSAKETRSAKEKAYRELLNEISVLGQSIDNIMKVTNLDNIKLDKDGNIVDRETVKKSAQSEWAGFITTNGEKNAAPETPPTNGGKTPMTRDDIMKIKDTSERQAAIAENLDLFGG